MGLPLLATAVALALTGGTAVWTADSMRRVSLGEHPTAADLAARTVDLELARGECESAQVCISVSTTNATVANVSVSMSELRTADGRKFSGSVDFRRVGYLPRWRGGESHPLAPDERENWVAEPLLPLRPLFVAAGTTRVFWLTVRADRAAAAGLYVGKIDVRSRAGRLASLDLRVRVRAFALPETFGLRTGYNVMDGFTKATYPDDFKVRRRESWDIMLDHRLNPNDISRTTLPDLDELEYARSRGMNAFCVLHLVPPPTNSAKWVCQLPPDRIFNDDMRAYLDRTLPPYLAELRKRGLDRYAYLYGFDEWGKEYYSQMLDFCREVREKYGLPVLTSAYMFRDVVFKRLDESSPLATMADWHCPPLECFRMDLADRYRAKGKKVWTYTCCYPHYPMMNGVSYEYPLIENRLLFWQVRRVRADGLLYWLVNNWLTGVWLDEREDFFRDWNTANRHKMAGDGIYLYPGRKHVLPGIRLANLRDGEEDYEWLQMAEARAGREAVEDLIGRVVRAKTKFTRDPKTLREVRRALGDLIEPRDTCQR